MNYEEYLQKNPKARLIAQCMAANMDKQASMDKQALNIGAKLGQIGSMMKGKAQRAGKRISDAYQKGYHAWDRVEMYPGSNVSPEKAARMREALQKLRGRISAAGQVGREVGNAGRMIGRGFDQLPIPLKAGLAGGTGAAAGMVAGHYTGMGLRKLLGADDGQAKEASVHIPPAMRLMAHIIDGDGEWIAKVAACCKKSGKCSKVEHKQMPGK